MAEVERVGQQGRVVRPDIERHRQRQRGIDSASRGVEGELPDRDRHAAGTLVAQPKDPLVVGHHDQADVFEWTLAQELRDSADILGRDPDAPGPPDDVAEFLARSPHSRRVDDRQELLEVFGKEPVEQGRVAVLEGGQPDVLLERVILAPQVFQLELRLLADGEDPIREQPAEEERVTLRSREGQVLGQKPAAKERWPGERDRRRSPGRNVVVRSRQRTHPREDSPPAGGRAAQPAGRPTAPSPRPCRPCRTPRALAGDRCTGRSRAC